LQSPERYEYVQVYRYSPFLLQCSLNIWSEMIRRSVRWLQADNSRIVMQFSKGSCFTHLYHQTIGSGIAHHEVLPRSLARNVIQISWTNQKCLDLEQLPALLSQCP
jgi:hypothetical protein